MKYKIMSNGRLPELFIIKRKAWFLWLRLDNGKYFGGIDPETWKPYWYHHIENAKKFYSVSEAIEKIADIKNAKVEYKKNNSYVDSTGWIT